jgi:hypothetical protein
VLVSFLATCITFLFAGVVARDYWRRRRSYRLLWMLALGFYGIATAAQFAAELGGWDTGAFRVWYLFGGLLTAAYLGQGTAFLLLPRRVADMLMGALLLATCIAVFRTFGVTITRADILPPAGKFTPKSTNLATDLRALAVGLNVYGTLLLVGGAIWSAITYVDHMLDHNRRAGYRLASNLLIAGGSMVIAGAGSLEAFGHGEFLYAGEIAGIAIIFAGFLRSRGHMRFWFQKEHAPRAPGAAAPVELPAQPARSLRKISERTPAPRR